MRRSLTATVSTAAALVLLGTTAATAAPALAAPPAAAPSGVVATPRSAAFETGVARPAQTQTVRATHTNGGPVWQGISTTRSSTSSLRANLAATADIRVNYSAGFTTQVQAAFQAAVDVWKTQIRSTVPITIDAQWTPLGTGVLGQAGPANFRRDFTGAPRTGTWYPDALANSLAGRDLDTAHSEIQASFNSTFGSWYLGTDGRPGSNAYDFESVVLHELGHGLGFISTFDGLTPPDWTDQGRGYWGLNSTGDYPTGFDRFLVDGFGVDALDTTVYGQGSLVLGALLRGANGGLQWKGANGVQAGSGVRPKLYSPTSFEPGSSVGHLDEASYPAGSANALMTPYLQNGESAHDPGPIVRGMFTDLGWPATIEPTNSAIDARYAALGGSAGLLGPAITTQFQAKDSVGRFVTYRNGVIYWSPMSGAHEVHGALRSKWGTIGAEVGLMRYPVSDELMAPDGVGRFNDFQSGSIYWSAPSGAFELHGAIRTKWQQMNSVTGVLRYPTTDERGTPDTVGRYNHFQGGSIYWTSATGAHEVHGAIRAKWSALGWERSRLGYPTGDETAAAEGRRSTFQHGSITYVASTGALLVRYF